MIALGVLSQYTTLGYRLHPLKPDAKVPILQNWPERAARDEVTVRQWLAEFPGCNWGIATGEGFSVLDIDPAALEAGWPGDQRRQELKATGCPLVRTPRGGFHLYFKANWQNSVGVIAPGVDTKGPRGYVVAPPSSVNGKSYRWLRPLVPRDQLPPPPSWLAAKGCGNNSTSYRGGDSEARGAENPYRTRQAGRHQSEIRPLG